MPLADFMDDEDDGAVEAPLKKQKTTWTICGFDSTQYEEDELLTPSLDRSTCFGCVYVGERDKTTIRFERVADLIRMIRTSVARSDPVVMARHVAKEYAKLRREVNTTLIEGEAPLPKWDAAMVLDHVRYHNTDPEMQTWLRLTEIQEVLKVARRSMIERDDDNGEKRVNPQQFRVYKDAANLWNVVAKVDPSKCTFRSNESLIDMKAACQPIIALTDKTIVDYFEKLPS